MKGLNVKISGVRKRPIIIFMIFGLMLIFSSSFVFATGELSTRSLQGGNLEDTINGVNSLGEAEVPEQQNTKIDISREPNEDLNLETGGDINRMLAGIMGLFAVFFGAFSKLFTGFSSEPGDTRGTGSNFGGSKSGMSGPADVYDDQDDDDNEAYGDQDDEDNEAYGDQDDEDNEAYGDQDDDNNEAYGDQDDDDNEAYGDQYDDDNAAYDDQDDDDNAAYDDQDDDADEDEDDEDDEELTSTDSSNNNVNENTQQTNDNVEQQDVNNNAKHIINNIFATVNTTHGKTWTAAAGEYTILSGDLREYRPMFENGEIATDPATSRDDTFAKRSQYAEQELQRGKHPGDIGKRWIKSIEVPDEMVAEVEYKVPTVHWGVRTLTFNSNDNPEAFQDIHSYVDNQLKDILTEEGDFNYANNGADKARVRQRGEMKLVLKPKTDTLTDPIVVGGDNSAVAVEDAGGTIDPQDLSIQDSDTTLQNVWQISY
jgi:hypothetical protein